MPHPFDLQSSLPNKVRLELKLRRSSIWMLFQPYIIFPHVHFKYYLYGPLCEHHQPLFFSRNYIPVSHPYTQNSNHVLLYVYFNLYVFLFFSLDGIHTLCYNLLIYITDSVWNNWNRENTHTYLNKPTRSALNKINVVILTILETRYMPILCCSYRPYSYS